MCHMPETNTEQKRLCLHIIHYTQPATPDDIMWPPSQQCLLLAADLTYSVRVLAT